MCYYKKKECKVCCSVVKLAMLCLSLIMLTTLGMYLKIDLFSSVHELYDLVPKGALARGYTLQLKIKHC